MIYSHILIIFCLVWSNLVLMRSWIYRKGSLNLWFFLHLGVSCKFVFVFYCKFDFHGVSIVLIFLSNCEVPCHQKPVSYFKYNWSCILRNISLNNNTWSLIHLTENISSQSKASIAFPIRSLLMPVSSMLTFPLRYNFPPWSLRITS